MTTRDERAVLTDEQIRDLLHRYAEGDLPMLRDVAQAAARLGAEQERERCAKVCEQARASREGWVIVPVEPTPEMIDKGAQRLVRFEDGSVWPDSFDSLDQAAAKNEAERVWRSMLAAAAPRNVHDESEDRLENERADRADAQRYRFKRQQEWAQDCKRPGEPDSETDWNSAYDWDIDNDMRLASAPKAETTDKEPSK